MWSWWWVRVVRKDMVVEVIRESLVDVVLVMREQVVVVVVMVRMSWCRINAMASGFVSV